MEMDSWIKVVKGWGFALKQHYVTFLKEQPHFDGSFTYNIPILQSHQPCVNISFFAFK